MSLRLDSNGRLIDGHHRMTALMSPMVRHYYVTPWKKRKLVAMRRLGAPVLPTFLFSEEGPTAWLLARAILFVLVIIATFGYVGVVLNGWLFS